MKYLIFALVSCLFLSSFATGSQRAPATFNNIAGGGLSLQTRVPDVTTTEPVWVTFSSPEGRFSLQFPKKPGPDVKEVDSVVGKLTMYTFSASSSTVTYMASFADYPTEPDANRQMAVLDAVRDGVVSKIEARIYDQTRIAIDGNPGRQFLMTKTIEGSELIYHWRIYLVGRRLYQVAAAYYKRYSQLRELPKYFDSFQLLN